MAQLNRTLLLEQVKTNTGLSDEQVMHLLQSFYNDLPHVREELMNSYQQESWTGIRKWAHRNKPVFMLFGVEPATSILLDILQSDWEMPPPPEKLKAQVDAFMQNLTVIEAEIAQLQQA